MSASYPFPQFISPEPFYYNYIESCPNCPKCALKHMTNEVIASCPNCRKCTADKDKEDKCSLGPSYWCESDTNFKQCHGENVNRNDFKVCMLDKSKKMENSEKCELGPSHWCSSDENFKQCHGMTNDRSKYQVCKPYL
jgi:hypothetical protein